MLIHAVLVVAMTLASADDPKPEPKLAAPPKADIRGKISTVSGAPNATAILVEGVKEKDTEHDKASVRFTKKTKFFLWEGGKKKEAKVSDLKAGIKVQCVFTGPVAESYPVQATASEVLILPAK